MVRALLIILTALATVFPQLECLAYCADQCIQHSANPDSTPPCHSHQRDSQDRRPTSCGHVNSAVAAPREAVHFQASALSTVGQPAASCETNPATTLRNNLPRGFVFPPGADRPPSAVLRI
jgi:hypothetical protein